ncbi:MAG: hypothetical protein ABL962_02180 [Fimbriimonadaceae bacterium]
MRVFFTSLFALLVLLASAETLITDAKVISSSEGGYVLQVGTQPLAVEDNYQTRYYRNKETVKRDAFKGGDTVVCRIKTDADPPQLKEIADKPTWQWLDDVRKKPQRGTITKIDSKYVTVKLDIGGSHSYRATDKSDVLIGGKPGSLSDLKSEMVIYIKGRTLPTLDTFADLISNQAIVVAKKEAASSTGKQKTKKMDPIEPEGVMTGTITSVHTEILMFDIEADRVLHITFSSSTKFTLDGANSSSSGLAKGLGARVTYKRDKNGRIIASKVELFKS